VNTWDISRSNRYHRMVLRTSMTAAEAILVAWIRKWQSASGSMYGVRLYSGAG